MNRGQYIAILLVIVAGGALLAVNLLSNDDQTTATQVSQPPTTADTQGPDPAPIEAAPIEAPPILDDSPGNLTDLDGWLQTDATEFAAFDGQVRVVQFWTFSCINCKRTLPNLIALYEKFQPQGLEVIGVHSPEFDFEKDPLAIQKAADELGVVWPIAIDSNKTNFRSWQPGSRFWPRTFVLDQNGKVRFDHIGEGAYDELNATVEHLIENGP